MLSVKDRLIVALDVDTARSAEILVSRLQDQIGIYKIGLQLFNSEGPEIVTRIHRLGGKVFLDLKLHDIPNTVGRTAAVLTRLKVFMFNLHIAGGSEMMKKAAESTAREADAAGIPRPLVLGVTVLTSINQSMLSDEIGIPGRIEDQVVKWAKLAQASGLHGVVASPRETRAIRSACGPDFLIITPGVRPAWADADDQQRLMTPKEAVAAGADYLVIGRPITAASDPVRAARTIVDEMEEGLKC